MTISSGSFSSQAGALVSTATEHPATLIDAPFHEDDLVGSFVEVSPNARTFDDADSPKDPTAVLTSSVVVPDEEPPTEGSFREVEFEAPEYQAPAAAKTLEEQDEANPVVDFPELPEPCLSVGDIYKVDKVPLTLTPGYQAPAAGIVVTETLVEGPNEADDAKSSLKKVTKTTTNLKDRRLWSNCTQ
jgi:hypothetical protein